MKNRRLQKARLYPNSDSVEIAVLETHNRFVVTAGARTAVSENKICLKHYLLKINSPPFLVGCRTII